MNIKNIIIGALAIAFILGFITTCNKDKEIASLKFENGRLDSMRNAANQLVVTQRVELLKTKAEQEQLKAYSDSVFNLTKKQERKIKDVIAFYQAKTNIKIVDKLVPYLDTTKQKEWEDSVKLACQNVIDYYEANTIGVPDSAKVEDTTIYASLIVKKDGVEIDSLSIPDVQSLRFVTLKGGMLKKDQEGKRHLFLKKSLQVQVLHSSPYLEHISSQTYLYQEKKKTKLLPKLMLIGAGIIIGRL
jgi:hypothetical protein